LKSEKSRVSITLKNTGIFHEPQKNTLKQTFSTEISIKNLRQPEILLIKQAMENTYQTFFRFKFSLNQLFQPVFTHNFAVGKTEN
jgi:hypothetical protein